MSDLNEVAVQVGKRGLDTLEDKILELDLATVQANKRYDELREQAQQANEAANFLFRQVRSTEEGQQELRRAVRDLKQSREGFPYLNDIEYENRMLDLRVRVQEIVEALT